MKKKYTLEEVKEILNASTEGKFSDEELTQIAKALVTMMQAKQKAAEDKKLN
jgi:hypothetical protein